MTPPFLVCDWCHLPLAGYKSQAFRDADGIGWLSFHLERCFPLWVIQNAPPVTDRNRVMIANPRNPHRKPKD